MYSVFFVCKVKAVLSISMKPGLSVTSNYPQYTNALVYALLCMFQVLSDSFLYNYALLCMFQVLSDSFLYMLCYVCFKHYQILFCICFVMYVSSTIPLFWYILWFEV